MLQAGGADGAEEVPFLGAAGCRLVLGGQHSGALPRRGGAELPHLSRCLPLQPPGPGMQPFWPASLSPRQWQWHWQPQSDKLGSHQHSIKQHPADMFLTGLHLTLVLKAHALLRCPF